MVDKYVPKVGDKVRATLGENVLVGPVEMVEVYHNGFYAEVNISTADTWGLSSADGWHFEQIVSVPTKFGAVIRRADGQSFSLTARAQKACPWLTQSGSWTDDADATRGGFTVLVRRSRRMSAVYIFENIDRISDSWHNGGSVVIVTDRDPGETWRAHLQSIAAEHKSNAVYLNDTVIRQSLPEPTVTYELRDTVAESVMVFPDAGCC